MGRAPCCEKETVKRGPWTPEEDAKLLACVSQFGTGSWRTLPKKAGLQRCGKSCRLRWTNYLRPDLKHGRFSEQEEQLIVKLHAALGSRWSLIAAQLPGRTDNDVKNYWNTRLKKKLCEMGIDPITHKPISQLLADLAGSMALPKGGSSSNGGGGGDIAEATLGCFKDDMLNVLLMRKRSEINSHNGHHGHQSSATACPAAPPENPHAHLMNNIYNHNYSASRNNHRLITTPPPLPTMSFAPNHALIKPAASTNTTTNYSRRSLISGGGLSSSVVNPCGPVSGIRSAQARSNNARSNGPANHSDYFGTSHTNNNNYPPANYGANALSLLLERPVNDVMMIVDDLKHLDYDHYNLSNDEMMQNLKALNPSPLLVAMNSRSSNSDGLNDGVVNGALNSDAPAEHAINGSGAFNDGDHSMDNDDDDDDDDDDGHGGGDEEVPDLNLMNEGRISALNMEQQKHPNLYTLLMNQHMEAEMMQKKKKKQKKEKEAEINMNSGDGNAIIVDQALQQNLGGNSNTGGVAQYANLIAHQDMMMMMMMAGHSNGHDPTAAQFHAENRPAHAPRVHHGLHNEGPMAFSAHDAAPGPPNLAARCEWSPSSYTNSGSSSSNLSLCNNNDVVTHGLVLGDHEHVHIVDTGDIPSIDQQADQQQTVVSPLDGLLWDLCELGSMVS